MTFSIEYDWGDNHEYVYEIRESNLGVGWICSKNKNLKDEFTLKEARVWIIKILRDYSYSVKNINII